jgi:hypothetical protein
VFREKTDFPDFAALACPPPLRHNPPVMSTFSRNSPGPTGPTLRTSGMIAATVALAALIAFGDAVIGDRVFAWRDAVHTFPGLVELIRSEWTAGRVPLWNPLLNNGQPLAAMNIAGALYPPQVVAALLLPTGAAVTVVVVGHLLLAAAAAARIALDAGRTPAAAALAGLAYGFCGSVVFQAYHPNIAAGVAWLGWAVCFGLRLGAGWSIRDGLGLAVSLACAVLAGDPQAAYLAGIVLVVWHAGNSLSSRAPLRGAAGAAARLAAAAVLAAALAWPQIAVTSEFMATTTRYADAYPVSVWDVPRCLRDPDPEVRRRWADVILGRPPPESSFYHQIYRFSVAPWRVLDLVSPALAGPLAARWTTALGLEGDVWVATIYGGAVPLAACLVALGLPGLRRGLRPWTLVAAVAFAASLGGFGVVGLTRAVGELISTGRIAEPYRPGDEVGGMAWLLTTVLPGYAGFRSPGKWLSCLALALAEMAACGADAAATAAGRSAWRAWLARVAVASAVVTTAAAVAAPAGNRLGVATGGGLCIVTAVLAIRLLDPARTPRWLHGREVAAVAVLTAIELSLVARLSVETAPLAAVRAGSDYLRHLEPLREPALAAAASHPRLAAFDGLIEIPPTADAAARARCVGLAQRCNTPLLHGWGKVGEPGTAMEADFELLCSPARTPAGLVFPRTTLDRSAVEFFVVPVTSPPAAPLRELLHDWAPEQRTGAEPAIVPAGPALPGATPPGADAPLVEVVRNASARPRVRVTRDVAVAPVVPAAPRARRLAALRPLAFPPGAGAAPATTTLEAADPATRAAIAALRAAADEPPGTVRIVTDEPRRVVVEARLAGPACVVLADTFHADWTATVTDEDGTRRGLDILRADHTLRGCLVPAGRHTIEYRHRSATFERAWPVAAVAWAVAIAAWLVRWRADRQPRAVEPSTRTSSAGLVRPS